MHEHAGDHDPRPVRAVRRVDPYDVLFHGLSIALTIEFSAPARARAA